MYVLVHYLYYSYKKLTNWLQFTEITNWRQADSNTIAGRNGDTWHSPRFFTDISDLKTHKVFPHFALEKQRDKMRYACFK
jgi:hypothetical protein